MEQPLVSVPVITYNSAKTVLETLESIKEQTYQNIELIVSDDCSTDDTVELCRNWIEQNKSRFARTELLIVEKNTGVSANLNRAEIACQGEWVKGIAGDDLLMPNCIQDCMDYVKDNPETIYLFGIQKAFGTDEATCTRINNIFDYSFFSKTQEEQLHRLVFGENCVPATTAFYNRAKVQNLGIKNDERIPFLEDWPKWINLLRAGVKLHFVDKVLVRYRVGGISSVNTINRNFYESQLTFNVLYRWPEILNSNDTKYISKIIQEQLDIFDLLVLINKKYQGVLKSKSYRLGRFLLKPFQWMKRK